jgi:hypothetical protein
MRRSLAIALVVTCAAGATAKTWDDAIRDVSTLAEQYRSFAYARDTTWAGTLYNSYHIRRHECAILGRLLGKAEEVRHLEEMDLPEITDDLDPHLALITSMSLSNWTGAARSQLAASEEERIYFWNLNCSGSEGIPKSAAIGERPLTSFEFSAPLLFVRGPVERGYADALIQAIDDSRGAEIVVLGSGGGNVGEALRAGRVIRERGLTTQLSDNCYSACPFVFLGGTKRILWAGSNRLGFHQISVSGVAVPQDHEAYRIISEYAWAMGADGEWVVQAMLAALPSGMNYVATEGLCDVGVATFVQYVCP